MKRQTGKSRSARKIRSAETTLEKQMAMNTAQLRRVHRTLQMINVWNRKLVQAAEILTRGIARDGEGQAGFMAYKQVAELSARYGSLTPRERQVMAFVVRGSTNKETAAHLGTAEITIKIHRANVMKKMKAKSIPDLVRIAERAAAFDPHLR